MSEETPAAEAPPPRWRRYRLFWTTALALFVVDQLTKWWTVGPSGLPVNLYPPFAGYEIIPGFFNIVHVENPGAAWGMFSGHGEWLAVFALLALGAIWRWRDEIGLRVPYVQFAFGGIVGGIVGNLVDRVARGVVVDFLDVILPGGYRWPTFNVADIGITVGTALYLWASFRPEFSGSPPPSREPEGPPR